MKKRVQTMRGKFAWAVVENERLTLAFDSGNQPFEISLDFDLADTAENMEAVHNTLSKMMDDEDAAKGLKK